MCPSCFKAILVCCGYASFTTIVLHYHCSLRKMGSCVSHTSSVNEIPGYLQCFVMTQSYEGYSHQKPAEEEHEDEVSRASSERALLEHTTVSVPESQWLRKTKSCQNHFTDSASRTRLASHACLRRWLEWLCTLHGVSTLANKGTILA